MNALGLPKVDDAANGGSQFFAEWHPAEYSEHEPSQQQIPASIVNYRLRNDNSFFPILWVAGSTLGTQPRCGRCDSKQISFRPEETVTDCDLAALRVGRSLSQCQVRVHLSGTTHVVAEIFAVSIFPHALINQLRRKKWQYLRAVQSPVRLSNCHQLDAPRAFVTPLMLSTRHSGCYQQETGRRA